MITYDEVLNLNFYKRSAYTGWINPLRFRIEMKKTEDGESIFHAWIWPAPYIFDLTDDNKKIKYTAPFTQDGKKEVVDWINAQYEQYKDIWSTKKM